MRNRKAIAATLSFLFIVAAEQNRPTALRGPRQSVDVKTFLRFFLFSKLFLFLKNVGNVQSGKQINKKHFQNNSNKIDL